MMRIFQIICSNFNKTKEIVRKEASFHMFCKQISADNKLNP